MKTSLALLGFSSFLAFTGCDFLSQYSEVEYNNLVVEKISAASLAIQETTQLYNETLPSVITEETEVDVSTLESSHAEAVALLENTEALATLESRNTEQQNAVRTELETYRSAASLYLESYETMLTFYSDELYKEDITQVETLDEDLHVNYTTFIEANNDLVDILENFVTPSAE